MRLSFDDGTLLLEDAPDTVPYADWDDRVEEYRAQAQYYREIREWATLPPTKTDAQRNDRLAEKGRSVLLETAKIDCTVSREHGVQTVSMEAVQYE